MKLLKKKKINKLNYYKLGGTLIPRYDFGGPLMRQMVPMIADIITDFIPGISQAKAIPLLIKALAKGEIGEAALNALALVPGGGAVKDIAKGSKEAKEVAKILKKTDTFKDLIVDTKKIGNTTKEVKKADKLIKESLRGKVVSPSQVTPDMFDFEHNWYFGHGTDPILLESILKNGLRGALGQSVANLFQISNIDIYNDAVLKAIAGHGLHNHAKGFNIIEVPKLEHQTTAPKDFLDYITSSDTKYVLDNAIPPRFNLFAIDATK